MHVICSVFLFILLLLFKIMFIKISEKFLKLIIHWITTFDGMIICYQAIMFETVLNTLKPKFEISNDGNFFYMLY